MYVSTYQRLKIKYPEITKLIFIPTSKPMKFRKCSRIKSQKQINTIKGKKKKFKGGSKYREWSEK